MLETRFVPRLDRTVTRLGLGALPMGPLQRTLSVEEGARVVRAAVEGGITFIDTATLYGTYEHIARGLKGWRGPVTLATKTHAKTDRALAEKHIETALKELGRDYHRHHAVPLRPPALPRRRVGAHSGGASGRPG